MIPPYDISAASRVAQVCRLSRVEFISLSAARVMAEPTPDQTGFHYDIAPVHAVAHHVPDENEFRVGMPFEVKVRAVKPGEQQGPEIASFSVAIGAIYGLTSPCEETELLSFAAYNGLMHLWPYLRAEVQSLTAKFHFPPLTLQVLTSGAANHVVASVKSTGDVASPAEVPTQLATAQRQRKPKKAKR